MAACYSSFGCKVTPFSQQNQIGSYEVAFFLLFNIKKRSQTFQNLQRALQHLHCFLFSYLPLLYFLHLEVLPIERYHRLCTRNCHPYLSTLYLRTIYHNDKKKIRRKMTKNLKHFLFVKTVTTEATLFIQYSLLFALHTTTLK